MLKLIYLFLISTLLFADTNQSLLFKSIDSLKEANRELSQISELNQSVVDREIDKIIESKNRALETLLDAIKTPEKLKPIERTKRLSFLSQRIAINQNRGNEIAIARDNLEIFSITLEIDFRNFINSLKSARENYSSKERIETILDNFYNLVKSIDYKSESKLYQKYKSITSSSVIVGFNKNYQEFTQREKLYIEIYQFLKLNIDSIQRRNFIINRLTFEYLKEFINTNSISKEINIYLNYYFDIKVGELLIAISIFLIVLYLKEHLIPFLIRFIESKLNPENVSSIKIHNYLKESLNFPTNILVLLFGFELALKLSISKVENEYLIFLFENGYLIILALSIYNLINNAIVYFSENIVHKYPNIKRELINFLVMGFKILLFIIIFLVILKQMGYNITAILASLGVGGIAIALAAKDTLTNLFGSLSIMLDDIFSQGDYIQSEKVRGVVVEIGIRSSTIRTFDNALVTVPNSQLAESVISNWSRRKIGREIRLNLPIKYQVKREDIKRAIEEIEIMLKEHPDISDETLSPTENIRTSKILSKDDLIGIKKDLIVRFEGFKTHSMSIFIYCFSKSTFWDEYLQIKEDVLYRIWEILERNSLEFATPTQSISIDNLKEFEKIN